MLAAISVLPSRGLSRCSLLLPYCLGVQTLHRRVNTTTFQQTSGYDTKQCEYWKWNVHTNTFVCLMADIRNVQLRMFISDRCPPNGRYSTPYSLDITAGKASSTQRWVLWKFCSVKTNNSPFHLTAGLLKVLMTDLLCLLLLGLH